MQSRLQILVVADDADARRAIRRALLSAELETDLHEATDEASALQLLGTRTIDCVVTDYRLAGDDALAFVREARDRNLRCPFLVLTEPSDEPAAVALMKAGATDCLLKTHATGERLAHAIENATRVHRTERSRADIEARERTLAAQRTALAEVSLAINATLSLESLAMTLTERARGVVGARHAQTRIREHGAELTVASDSEICQPSPTHPVIDELTEQVAACNRPFRLAKSALARRMGAAHAVAFLAVPLIGRRGESLGVVRLLDKQLGDFTEDDEALLVQLAQFASLSVENAHLLARAQRARDNAEASAARLERLQAITTALSQPAGASHVMEIIVEQAVTILDCERVGLFTVNDGGILKLCAHRNLPPAILTRLKLMSLQDGFLVAKSVAARTPIYVHDLAAYAREAPTGAQVGLWSPTTRSVLCIPLSLGNAPPLGAIAMTFAQERSFTGTERAFFESLSDQWTQAIDRARLHESERVARRQAESAREQAETANRLKDEFLATISHELRTPLQSILGWARLLRDLPLDERVQKGVEIIERNARAQARLIEDILDVSRIITGKLRLNPRQVSVESIVQSAVDTLRAAADAKHITLTLDLAPDAGTLVGDPDRLQQVVWNLLSNAVKFTPPHGMVDICARREGDEIAISVRDTGRGIAKEFVPHVFQRFRQADASTTRTHSGLGLGLAIVRHLTELHGGRVSALSDGEDHGATFTVRLPVRASVSPPPPEDEQTIRARRKSDAELVVLLSEKRVLVVDDEADARELVATVFSQAGARVASAVSAAEGFEKCLEFRPDLLVCDIAMPDEDGYALLRRVRALAPPLGNLPVIALTAFARADDRTRALRAGFTLHLAKPIDPQVLLAAAAQALARRG